MSTEIARVEFTGPQIELIKRLVCVGANDDELSLFLNQCRRTGLDPFAKQIYGIKLRGKLTIQVGIDGMRLIAQRTGEMDGQDGPYWCGEDGVWRDVWLAKTRPLAAKVTVFRKGQSRGYTGTARMEEYYRAEGGMWDKFPAAMLAKCAESLALRKGFPQELSGIYSQDELDQADEAPAPRVTQPKPAPLPAADPLEEPRNRLRHAATLADLVSVWAGLSPAVQVALRDDKNRRKAELTPAPEAKAEIPVPEGEQRADFTAPPAPPAPPTAPTAPSAAAAPAAASAAAPAPKPAPNTPLAQAQLDRILAITKALDTLDLVWHQVRDRTDPRATAIADAIALPLVPATRLNQLPGPLQDALRAHCEALVREREARAAKREAGRARKAQEVGT